MKALRHAPILFGSLLLLAVEISPAAPPDPPRMSPVRVTLHGTSAEGAAEAPLRVALVRADYELDVTGASAAGILVQEFRNDGERPVMAVYACSSEIGFDVRDLTLEAGGQMRELPFEKELAAEDRRSRQRRAEPRAWRLRGAPFLIEGGQSIVVRAGFRLGLPVEAGRFRLDLRPVREDGRASLADGAAGANARPRLPASVTVRVLHDAPLVSAESPTHRILSDFEGECTVVELVDKDGLDGRPFVLRFATVPEDRPVLAGYVATDKRGGSEVTAVLNPPAAPASGAVRLKQVLFVLDTSGSMRGGRLEEARRALIACMRQMADGDRFNIFEFDQRFTALGPQPVSPTDVSIEDVARWLDTLAAHGGTKLLPALEAALAQPADPDRHRMIVLLSDGRIEDEKQVLGLLEAKLAAGRLFVVGIGPGSNQEAVLRLAEFGRGAAAFASDADHLESAVVELFTSIAEPLAWDIAVEWGTAEVRELRPERVPDLYAGRPVKVQAWVPGELPTELRLRVTTMAGADFFTVKLPPVD